MARKSSRYDPGQPKQTRCAIYTRKSTDEGLDMAFNSLDAQREACAAYITSQRHEGWTSVPDIYDDGGFSGGTMERPALKRLLAEVEAGRVDVIVVYKVDRLTRSLSDFARIVDVLDARGASFVSITQSFNTTTSMGRLTLNVLLSFAQFEREVTGERIRDKIAQSKARGMWMGGVVPLGYDVRDRKLVIREAEAATVRHVFSRYVALGSGQLLIEELRRDGHRTKQRVYRDGQVTGGVPFERGALFYLLGNRVYLGQIVHKGESFQGEHLALIDQQLWDAVQAQMDKNRAEPTRRGRVTERSLLAGILRDGEGRRMSPSHATKNERRYRYYITHSSELARGSPAAWRLPAHDLERIVVGRLRVMLLDRRVIRQLVDPHDQSAAALQLAITTAATLAAQLDTSEKRHRLTAEMLEDVQVADEQVIVALRVCALLALLRVERKELQAGEDQPLVLISPVERRRVGKEVRLLIPAADKPDDGRDTKLLALFAEALTVRETLLANPDRSIAEMAAQMGACRSRMARLLRLSFVAPDLVHDAVAGELPSAWSEREMAGEARSGRWHAAATAVSAPVGTP